MGRSDVNIDTAVDSASPSVRKARERTLPGVPGWEGLKLDRENPW